MEPAVPMTNPRSRLRYTAPLILRGVATGTAPGPDPDAVPVLVSRDYSRLRALARLYRHPDGPVGRALADTLNRCQVVPSEAVASTVAVLGARVEFIEEGGALTSCILAIPEDDAQDGSTLAVSTPVGAALLGATAGQLVEAVGRDGRRVALRLLAVNHRPGMLSAGAMPLDRRAPRGTAWCEEAPDDLSCGRGSEANQENTHE
jgi:regulator of nucleoside diphosphate kinase